ncbi:MAG: sulfite exporter TauE/SafE family protein [Nitrospirota bacterium]|nr:sulfite exporter TauE/SafE family protein [Nitrospirota bacterium]
MTTLSTLLLLFVATGCGAGFLAGLLGVGGGLVVVPVLSMGLTAAGLSRDVVVHLAVGTSLASIAVTSLSSMRAHHRHGAVRWEVARTLAPSVALGALTGAAIARGLPTDVLRLCVALFALTVAARLGLGLGEKPTAPQLPRIPETAGIPGAAESPVQPAAGLLIGGLSALVGIGGGTLTVPYLLRRGLSMHQAVATSAACGLPIALAGSAGFILFGWGDPALPSGSFGFVYVPALVIISTASMLFAPLGAKAAHALPARALKRWFALVVGVMGIAMLAH